MLTSSSKSFFPILAANSAVGSFESTWINLYFKTKHVTPFCTSHFATSNPSLLIDRARKPPPGAIITAVPLALPASGTKTVSVGFVTLNTTFVCQLLLSFSASFQFQLSEPGGGPSYNGITFCWAFTVMNVIIKKLKKRKYFFIWKKFVQLNVLNFPNKTLCVCRGFVYWATKMLFLIHLLEPGAPMP